MTDLADFDGATVAAMALGYDGSETDSSDWSLFRSDLPRLTRQIGTLSVEYVSDLDYWQHTVNGIPVDPRTVTVVDYERWSVVAAGRAEFGFDPSQPRADDGKWVDTGRARIAPRLAKEPGDAETTTMELNQLSAENKQNMLDRLHEVGAVPREYKTVEAALGFMEANIQSVLDTATPAEREAWRKWYPAGHDYAHMLAARHAMTEPVAAVAMIAALSPGTEWNVNVAMAASAMKTLSENRPVTAAQAAYANNLKQEGWARRLKAHNTKQAKARVAVGELAAELADEDDPKQVRKLQVAIAKKEAIIARPPPEQPAEDHFKAGTRPGDLPPGEAAYLVRAADPNPVVRELVVNADGTINDSDLARNGPTKAQQRKGLPGTPQKGSWQSYENIAKAISVYRNPTAANISTQMGKEHKVRTFFNNLNDPLNPANDATIDTHSAGISIGVPLAIQHPFIASGSESIMSAPSSVADGTSGTYALMAQAHRNVAARNGLRGPEVQSITWTAWRRMHTPAERSIITQKAKAVAKLKRARKARAAAKAKASAKAERAAKARAHR